MPAPSAAVPELSVRSDEFPIDGRGDTATNQHLSFDFEFRTLAPRVDS
jgi:hypothetical protein